MAISKKKKKLIIVSLVLILGVALVVLARPKNKVEYSTATVEKGRLVQTVSEVGVIQSDKDLNLSFAQSGRLAKLNFAIGDYVQKDDVIAELDYSSYLIKEQEAQSNLDVATANLNKLLSGATSQEVAVIRAQAKQAEVAHLSAQTDFVNTENSVAENISQTKKTLDDLQSNSPLNVTPLEQAITTAEVNLANTKNTYQQIIDNRQSSLITTAESKLITGQTSLDKVQSVLDDEDGQYAISVKNKSYLSATNNYYGQAEEAYPLVVAALSFVRLNPSDENLDNLTALSEEYLDDVLQAVVNCYSALENSIVTTSFTQTELDAYKSSISTEISTTNNSITSLQTAVQNLETAILNYSTNVATAEDALQQSRVNLNNAIVSAQQAYNLADIQGQQQLATAQAKVDSTKEAWQVAENQLSQVLAPARSEDVSLARAQVSQAEAALDLIRKQIEDHTIISPLSGRISKMDYEIGEQIGANMAVVSLLAEDNLEVEVDISESDIVKININDPAEISFDALGEDTKYYGHVIFIEPAETVIQDVIYYKVTIYLDELSEQDKEIIKPGMTVNILITTAEKEDVLIVPNRAIVDRNGEGKFLRVLREGDLVEVPAQLGLRGDDGLVELIASGVVPGEQVVTFIKELK